MAPPTSADLLDVWEQTGGLSHPERAVVYAQAAEPGMALADVLALPVGQRDAAVARLRSEAFGGRLAATTPCPRCGEVMELELDVGSLVPAPTERGPSFEVVHDGWRVTFRPPSTTDILEVHETGGGVRGLVERCVESAWLDGAPMARGALPPDLVTMIGERSATADPAADIRLDLTCAACGAAWTAPFDIVGVVDRELDAWARSTLQDVASLARAFGWSEREVLALAPSRRRRYIDLASA